MGKAETEEHKKLKELISEKLHEWIGISIQEYYDSGHELDIKAITLDGIDIYIEIVVTNLTNDLLMIHRSDAKIKMIVVANRSFLMNKSKDYQKTAIAEISKGFLMPSEMIDGNKLLIDSNYLENNFKKIIFDLIEKAKEQKKQNEQKNLIEYETINEVSKWIRKQSKNSEINTLGFEINFQRYPEIPSEFIERKEKVIHLNNLLESKRNLFIYGLSRSSKTFLVAQFLKEFNISDYYWYDFKLDSDNELFYNDFVRFICVKTNKKFLFNNWLSKQIHITFFKNLFQKYSKGHKIYVVLDNIHCFENPERIYSLFNTSENNCNHNIVFISENRDTLVNVPIPDSECNNLEINGFDVNEIKNLYQINGIEVDKLGSIFDMIHYQTMGHPDIIFALLEEIKKSPDKNIIKLFEFSIGNLKLDKTQKLNETLYSKLFNIHLNTKNERVFFNRLCLLVFSFDKQLAEKIAEIKPRIQNSNLIFEKLKIKLFDFEGKSKFNIPILYKNIGVNSLTLSEKNSVFVKAAQELYVIKNNIIDFNNAYQSCYYLLLANDFENLLKRLNFIINIIFQNYKGDKLFEYALSKLELFGLITNIPDNTINDFVLFKFFMLNGNSIIKNIKKEETFLNSFDNIVFDKVEPQLRVLILFYIFISASKFSNKTELSIKYLKLFSYYSQKDSEVIKKSKYGEHLNSLILSLPIYGITSYEFPNLNYLNSIISIYIELKFNIMDILPKLNVKELFDSFFHIYLINKYTEKFKDNFQLDQIIIESETLSNKFESINYLFAVQITNYFIACCITEFSKIPTESIKYYELAKKLAEKEKNYNLYEVEYNVGIADSYFKENNFIIALKYYIKARTFYHKIKSEDFLYVHTTKRIAICFLKSKKIRYAEKYFRRSLKLARNLKTNQLINTYETLGDLSTFYIEIEDFISATKVFSIMIDLLNTQKLKEYEAVTGNCISWVSKSLRNHLDKQDELSDRTLIKPYFNIYGYKTDFDKNKHEQHSLLIIHYVLGQLCLNVGLKSRAKHLLISALNEPVTKSFEIPTKFLTCINLYDLYLEQKDFKKAAEMIIKHLQYWENTEIDHPKFLAIKTPEKILEYSQFVYNERLVPIINQHLKRCDTKQEFNLCEEFFKYFIKLCNESNIQYKKYLLSIAFSNLGLLYAYNIHLENSIIESSPIFTFIQKNNYLDRHMKLMVIAERIAKSLNFYYVHIQNRSILQFSIYKGIHDLNNFAFQNFQILYYISLDWQKYSNFMNYFYNNFKRVWTGLEDINSSGNIYSNIIYQDIIESLNEFKIVNENDIDKFLTLTILFIRISDDIKINNLELLSVIEVCIKLISENFKNYFNIILSKFHKLQKEEISKELENIDSLVQKAKKGIGTFEVFEIKFSNILKQELKDKIQEYKRELRALCGEI